MSLSDDFLRQAKQLVQSDANLNSPSQIDLRRAVSDAYYAVFHELCLLVAEEFAGDGKSLKRAWLQTYRSLNHGTTKNRLLEIFSFSELEKDKKEKREEDNTDLNFPVEVAEVADIFASLQAQRHEADYNQAARFDQVPVIISIRGASKCIKHLRTLTSKHRRALAIFLSLQNR